MSADGGASFVNGTLQALAVSGDSVTFSVALLASPTTVRYTANQGFPQCAVVGAGGLPAMPFLYML